MFLHGNYYIPESILSVEERRYVCMDGMGLGLQVLFKNRDGATSRIASAFVKEGDRESSLALRCATASLRAPCRVE